jgi:hypothetical protein
VLSIRLLDSSIEGVVPMKDIKRCVADGQYLYVSGLIFYEDKFE